MSAQNPQTEAEKKKHSEYQKLHKRFNALIISPSSDRNTIIKELAEIRAYFSILKKSVEKDPEDSTLKNDILILWDIIDRTFQKVKNENLKLETAHTEAKKEAEDERLVQVFLNAAEQKPTAQAARRRAAEAYRQTEERNREIEETYALLCKLNIICQITANERKIAADFWDHPGENLKKMEAVIRDNAQYIPGEYVLPSGDRETHEPPITPAAEQIYLDAVQYYAKLVSTTKRLEEKEVKTPEEEAQLVKLQNLIKEAKKYATGPINTASPYSNNSLAVLAHQMEEKTKLKGRTEAREHKTETTTKNLTELLSKNILTQYNSSKRNWAQKFGAFKEERTKQINLIQKLKDTLAKDTETDPTTKAKILYSALELLNEQLLKESRVTSTKSRLESIIEKDLGTLRQNFPSLSEKAGEPERDQHLSRYAVEKGLKDIVTELLTKEITGVKRKR